MKKIGKSRAIVFAILSANLLLFSHSVRWDFATMDEVRQIPAGLSHWRLGSFKLANDNPPLPRLVATLPVLAADHTEWFLGYIDRPLYLNSAIKDQISAFFAHENAGRFVGLVRLARLPGYGWWLLGAWVVFRWSRSLYGDGAGYLALLLWGLEPNVLATEAQASADLPAAVAGIAASYAFWRHLGRPSWETALVAGFAMAIAQLTDFAAVLLYALWTALAAIHRMGGRPGEIAVPGLGQRAGHAALIGLLSLWGTNTGYAAADSGLPLKDFNFLSRALGGELARDPLRGDLPVGNRFREVALGRLPIPLPADYLRGIDLRIAAAEAGSPSPPVEGGAVRRAGPSAPALATFPFGLSIMVLWGTWSKAGRHAQSYSYKPEAFWGLPLLSIVALTASGPGLHLLSGRFVLAIPYAIVAASQLAGYLNPDHLKAGVLVAALSLWATWSSLAVLPKCLIHAAGGGGGHPGPGADRWGGTAGEGDRDLLRLRDWQRIHPEARPLGVAVRHLIDPQDHGIECSTPPVAPGTPTLLKPFTPPEMGPQPGYFALDAYSLETREYQYFRHFRPIDHVGSKISIFRVSVGDADRIRSRTASSTGAAEVRGHPPEGRTPGWGHAFRLRRHESPGGRGMNYALFVPRGYRGDVPYPLILFLHGFGDAGTEGLQYLKVGLPRIIEQGFDPGFIVLCPQGRTGSWSPESEDGREVLAILAVVQREFKVDPRRVVLTGVSSGGLGTWELAARHPGRWAAIVPVSSGCDEGLAARIRHIPCWCFHNCNDASGYYHKYATSGSPVEGPRRMIRVLAAGGGSPRYSEFLKIGDTHNAWDKAYTTPELYSWLAGQRRP